MSLKDLSQSRSACFVLCPKGVHQRHLVHAEQASEHKSLMQEIQNKILEEESKRVLREIDHLKYMQQKKSKKHIQLQNYIYKLLTQNPLTLHHSKPRSNDLQTQKHNINLCLENEERHKQSQKLKKPAISKSKYQRLSKNIIVKKDSPSRSPGQYDLLPRRHMHKCKFSSNFAKKVFQKKKSKTNVLLKFLEDSQNQQISCANLTDNQQQRAVTQSKPTDAIFQSTIFKHHRTFGEQPRFPKFKQTKDFLLGQKSTLNRIGTIFPKEKRFKDKLKQDIFHFFQSKNMNHKRTKGDLALAQKKTHQFFIKTDSGLGPGQYEPLPKARSGFIINKSRRVQEVKQTPGPGHYIHNLGSIGDQLVERDLQAAKLLGLKKSFISKQERLKDKKIIQTSQTYFVETVDIKEKKNMTSFSKGKKDQSTGIFNSDLSPWKYNLDIDWNLRSFNSKYRKFV